MSFQRRRFPTVSCKLSVHTHNTYGTSSPALPILQPAPSRNDIHLLLCALAHVVLAAHFPLRFFLGACSSFQEFTARFEVCKCTLHCVRAFCFGGSGRRSSSATVVVKFVTKSLFEVWFQVQVKSLCGFGQWVVSFISVVHCNLIVLWFLGCCVLMSSGVGFVLWNF